MNTYIIYANKGRSRVTKVSVETKEFAKRSLRKDLLKIVIVNKPVENLKEREK